MEIRRASAKDLELILKINENVYSGLDYLQILLPENGFPRHLSTTARIDISEYKLWQSIHNRNYRIGGKPSKSGSKMRTDGILSWTIKEK